MADDSFEINIEKLKWPREIKKFEGLVLYSLKSFQSIELILKAYLSIDKNTEADISSMPLGLGEFEKMPMGQLIKKFKKINNNQELMRRLNEVLDDRNIIAHQALLLGSTSIRNVFELESLSLSKLEKIEKRASKAYLDLVKDFVGYELRARKEKKYITSGSTG